MAVLCDTMRCLFLLWIILTTSTKLLLVTEASYEPNWESLDKRPTPSWYDESKFGVFLHWGVFSVPSYGSEWFWYRWQTGVQDYVDFVNKTERPDFRYAEYAPRFDASLYNATEWATLFEESGAQYVVLTSKHHEGYCNWDSRNIPTTWNWNAMDVGPKRDLVGELAKAVKSVDKSTFTNKPLHFGLYHSLFEWFNPAFLQDLQNNFTTTVFRDTKTMPELYDIVNKYEPHIIWSDGYGGANSSNYWNAPEFLAWLVTNSSVADTVVYNDRWGKDVNGKHGSFITPADRYNPGQLIERKWENALTIDATSWGFNRHARYTDYLSVEYFVFELIQVVAWGGNMLLNVGPNHDGTIAPIFYDRLLGIGSWLKVNGPAIYATRPWRACQNETQVDTYYTRRDQTLFAIMTKWPIRNVLELQAPIVTTNTQVTMLGYKHAVNFSTRVNGHGMLIRLPPLTPNELPCQYAWTFAITSVVNLDSNQDGTKEVVSEN